MKQWDPKLYCLTAFICRIIFMKADRCVCVNLFFLRVKINYAYTDKHRKKKMQAAKNSFLIFNIKRQTLRNVSTL